MSHETCVECDQPLRLCNCAASSVLEAPEPAHVCIGAWVSGSGGHRVFARDCAKEATWLELDGGAAFCDEHMPLTKPEPAKAHTVDWNAPGALDSTDLAALLLAATEETRRDAIAITLRAEPEPAKASGWISVSERMPEPGKLVQFAIRGESTRCVGYYYPAVNGHEATWLLGENDVNPATVYAWRELPAPPDSEGK